MQETRWTWDYFFTITLKPTTHNESWNQQRSYFEKFIDSIQHHKITSVIELQSNGSMHIHGLISFEYLPLYKDTDFRKYFFKMKRKIKQLGKTDFQVADNYNKVFMYITKEINKGYVLNPVIIDDYGDVPKFKILNKYKIG